jgi:hypothetical protein
VNTQVIGFIARGVNKRVAGFVLLAAAVVGGLAAFATAKDYAPQLGIVRATQVAYIWTDCSSPHFQPCPLISREQSFTVTLAHALVASTAVGFTGLGLIVFGKGGSA